MRINCCGWTSRPLLGENPFPQQWIGSYDRTLSFAEQLERGILTHLGDVPFEFVHFNRKFVLRGAILFGGSHWTTVARLPKCWMHYDGMLKDVRFHLYSLDRKGCYDAMGGRAISSLFYEVMGMNDSLFGCGK